jgi:hypothetical protein
MIREVEGPLYGIRRWGLTPDGLDSITARYVWPGPVVKAKFNPRDNYYALFSWNDIGVTKDPILKDWIGRNPIYRDIFGICHGIVELLGDVSIHEYGFRSEYAVIRELFVDDRNPSEDLRALDKYECPVHVMDVKSHGFSYNAQLANRYREGTLYDDLENITHWCSHFLWHKADGSLLPLGECSDTHLRNIHRWAERVRDKVMWKESTMFQAILEEMDRRRMNRASMKEFGIRARFTPVKGEPNP